MPPDEKPESKPENPSSKKVEAKEIKTESSKVKHKTKKRAWILLLISLCCIVSVIWGYTFLVQSVPAFFTSKLTEVGDIELSYSEKQSEKISPLCGCYDVGEWENWRGITFTARNIEVERKGDLPATGYYIASPYPTSTEVYSQAFKMRTTYYLIELNQEEKFNPQYLITNRFPENYKVLRKEDNEEGFVQIFTAGKLNIALLGDKPIGSWIPMEKSNVLIGYQSGPNLTAPTGTIKEKYLASTKEELDQVWINRGNYMAYDQTKMSMPLGDFLGPDIVFWNDSEQTSILTSSQVIQIPKNDKAGKKLVKGIVVNPPFAVRIVAIPFGDETIHGLSPESGKRGEKDYSYLSSQGRFDTGEVTIKIDDPTKQAQDFENFYKLVKHNGTTVSDFKAYNSSQIAGGKMTFRYPPTPPNEGFNIFGKVNKLKIHSASGNLSIGSRSYNMEAPVDFELREIKEMTVKNGVMEIPVQIGINAAQSKILLTANSEIYVNNESITRRIDNNKTFFDYIVLIATVFGLVLGIISAVFAYKSFQRT